MRRAWRREWRRIAYVLLLGFLGGWMFEAPRLGLIVAISLYVLYNLRLLQWLAQWVESPKQVELPDAGGVWGEIFDQLYAMQRRNKKRKRKLASIVAEFQASTAALPDGAIVVSSRGEIAWFNNAAQALLGLRSPQDNGQRIANLVRHPRFADYLEGEDYEHDIEVPSPLNEQYTLSMRLIPYGEGQRLLIIRDVSEHKRLDLMRRDFVANASHELRTPLTVLRGYVEMMEPEAQGDGELRAWRAPLREMAAQTVRMEALINDLLRLARLEGDTVAPRNEPVDMPSLCERSIEQARHLSQGRHRINADIEPRLWLYGRESELQSIATNLVSNAVRYTPEGGDITLVWSELGNGAVLRVRDAGIGIAEADIPRLTERFYRVDIGRSRASGGTGLGLAIVKHALEHHDAQLAIDSVVGEGSEFSCHFPAHRVHRERARVVNG
jgi:two-component system phosphate regulon sensor histidine kinase PhoR